MAGPPLLFAMVVRNDGSIKSVDELKGRKVGISTVGSVTSWIVDEMSRQKGWGYNGMTAVTIGDDGTRVAAVESGAPRRHRQSRVALNYAHRGDGRIILRFGDLVKHFHAHVIFATDKSIAAKPDATAAISEGLVRKIAFMRAHKDETVKIAMPVLDTDSVAHLGDL